LIERYIYTKSIEGGAIITTIFSDRQDVSSQKCIIKIWKINAEVLLVYLFCGRRESRNRTRKSCDERYKMRNIDLQGGKSI